jgi:hypothetical protein
VADISGVIPLRDDDVAPTHPAQVPLGQLLLDAGLVTPEVLAQVLAEQERTGRKLGELLVEGGHVAGRSIALALARQQGGLVKTEYGFATAAKVEPEPQPQPEPEPVVVELVPLYREPEPQPEPEPEPEPAATVEPDPEPEPEPEPRHVLFVPDPAGYRLIERRGPCPGQRATVELDLGSFEVLRVAAAPFPGEAIDCAYLIAFS